MPSRGGRALRRMFDLNDIAVQQWIVGLFSGCRRERIHVAWLDRAKCLISDEALNDGTPATVEGNLRQIVHSGLGIDAAGLILMHNHPSGDVRPSGADLRATRQIHDVLASLDIRLEDHLIVSGHKLFSMRGAQLI